MVKIIRTGVVQFREDFKKKRFRRNPFIHVLENRDDLSYIVTSRGLLTTGNHLQYDSRFPKDKTRFHSVEPSVILSRRQWYYERR
jgi:hypothetical protein